ncbi:MAG: MFS transporter [Candidatus Pacebacteria bacterium]|nr:MFS transporter [Candidatus Paceibacterota bacterium]
MLSKAESILLWSSNLWMLGWGMLGPLFALFAQRVGGDVLETTWVYAVYLVVTGVGIFVVGKVTDCVGQEWPLVVGYALNTVATFSYLLVSTVIGLFVVQIVQGVALALMTPTWYALYDKHSGDGSHDGYVWGLFSGMAFIVQGIALMLGGYIVTAYSFDVLFVVMGTILAISTLWEARILQYRVQ